MLVTKMFKTVINILYHHQISSPTSVTNIDVATYSMFFSMLVADIGDELYNNFELLVTVLAGPKM